MNYVLQNRKKIQHRNYVLKADTSTGYWVGISKSKIDYYREKYEDNFSIIIFGDKNVSSDFYTIPFYYLKDVLTKEYMYSGRERWVADIKNHIIRFRNSHIERNISNLYSIPIITNQFILNPISDDAKNDYAIENAKREVTIRLKQSKFRKKVLNNFGYRCCISGIEEQDLLVASHIIPWSTNMETRLNPANGLCLFVLYDKLFDKGYFTLDDNLQIMITSRLKISEKIFKFLTEINGRRISLPVTYNISLEALRFHRENIYEKYL